ncbi:flagellar hook assembly protein FlgD [Methylophaga sp.]|uniref:flagellar hook assembly protein FlgD n=1 Tax=Methylophaga sp. TaxID=2024840 RepID=UPI003F6A2615
MAINGVGENFYSFLNKEESQKTEEKDAGSLALEDFMSLMTTQLKNQDPLKPMESGDFLGQIASFGTVSGIADLQDSFSSFAKSMQSDQALQGSSLVGRSVLVPSSIGMMTPEDGMTGQINVSEPVTDLKVQVFSENGVPVRTIEMGAASGYTNFTWDGFDANDTAMPEGIYQFRATGTVNGENTAFGTATVAKVSSVLVGSGSQGLTVNLAGIGSVPFGEVQEII